MKDRFRIVDSISHERLEDEVIAINLENGAYFAFDGAAADCWTIAAAGGTVDEIVPVLTARFDVTADVAATDATAFLAALVEHGLAIRDVADSTAEALPVLESPAVLGRYETPIVETYDDLETLLLIDPIHEVDDAGWPLPAPDTDA